MSTIEFAINNRRFTLDSKTLDPSLCLNEFVRDRAGIGSTKGGCLEGGCGSCAVMLSRYDDDAKKVVTVSINSCLRKVVTLHRCVITTADGLGVPGAPNPLQKRFADLNASQCGFCTPGAIVAVAAHFLNKSDSTMQEVESAMTGNLCRCTGYRPILDAAKSFAKDSDIVDQIKAIDQGTANLPLPPPPEPLGKTVQDKINEFFPAEWMGVADPDTSVKSFEAPGSQSYYRPTEIEQIAAILSSRKGKQTRICGAQLSNGIYKDDLPNAAAVVDVSCVRALTTGFSAVQQQKDDASQLAVRIPAMSTISQTIAFLHDVATTRYDSKTKKDNFSTSVFQVLAGLSRQLQAVANPHVRAVGSIAGNLAMCRFQGFASDVATPLAALGAELEVIDIARNNTAAASRRVPLVDYLKQPAGDADEHTLIVAIHFTLKVKSVLRLVCQRHAIRSVNAHCVLNCAVLLELEAAGTNGGVSHIIRGVKVAFGNAGITDQPFSNAPKVVTNDDLIGKPLEGEAIPEAAATAIGAAAPSMIEGDYKKVHRIRLVKALVYKGFIEAAETVQQQQPLALEVHRPLVKATQTFVRPADLDKEQQGGGDSFGPVGRAIPRKDGIQHACGTANYVSDIVMPGMLHAVFLTSPIPNGTFDVDSQKIDWATKHMIGFTKFVTIATLEKEAPGRYGVLAIPHVLGIMGMPFPGTPLFAHNEAGGIKFTGQPVGVVLSDESYSRAVAIAKWISSNAVTWNHEPKNTIITLDDIKARNGGPEVDLGPFAAGSAKRGEVEFAKYEKNFKAGGDVVKVELVSHMDSQLHWPLETLAAAAHFEGSKLVVRTQTQAPIAMPLLISASLNGRLKAAEIDFQQPRVGGSFGSRLGNITGPTVAVLCDFMGRRPVKLMTSREVDAGMTGGREESETTCVAYVNKNTKVIEASSFSLIKNAGCALDLSFFQTFALKRTFFSSYKTKSLAVDFVLKKSNLPSRGPTRAPGEIEGCYHTEALVDKIAFDLGCHSQDVRSANIFTTGGDAQQTSKSDNNPLEASEGAFTLPALMASLLEKKGWQKRIEETIAFNKSPNAKSKKRGAAVVPFRYFVSPSRGDALVNIYQDGSVLVHTAATEMGQGTMQISQQVAAMALIRALGTKNIRLPHEFVSHGAGNSTHIIPSQGITGGSMGTCSNAAAVINACNKLAASMKACIGEEALSKLDAAAAAGTKEAVASWQKLVQTCEGKRLPLSAVGICTSHESQKEERFAGPDYSIWSVGAAEIELDVPTGEVTLLRLDLEYDAGRSLNPAVDIGQCEGAVVMGIGHMLQERCNIDSKTGRLAAGGNTWEYKLPMPADLPRSFNVSFIANEKFVDGCLGSKATGEPPLCTVPCITSAVRQAIVAAQPSKFVELTVPYTADRVAAALGDTIFCTGQSKK